jgi:hypothetical protein
MTLISHADLLTLVQRYCPVFYLCQDDVFHPCSFEFFISKCRLVDSRNSKVLAEYGSLEPDRFGLDVETTGEHLVLELAVPEARLGQADMDNVPVYAHVKNIARRGLGVEDSEILGEALEITYITMFAHNGPYNIGFGIEVGAHDGDIEHVTVRVDCEDFSLIGVWYNSHRNHDGSWVKADQIETEMVNTDNRLVSYIARHGHGHYPTATITYRHFFLGNDITQKAVRWDPKRVVLLPTYRQHKDERKVVLPSTPSRYAVTDTLSISICICEDLYLWSRGCLLQGTLPRDDFIPRLSTPAVTHDDPCNWLRFKGLFGTARAPAEQSWFSKAEPPISRRPLLRLFFHFWPETYAI